MPMRPILLSVTCLFGPLMACSSHPEDEDLRASLSTLCAKRAALTSVDVGGCIALPSPVKGRDAEECKATIALQRLDERAPAAPGTSPGEQYLAETMAKLNALCPLMLVDETGEYDAGRPVSVEASVVFVRTAEGWIAPDARFIRWKRVP